MAETTSTPSYYCEVPREWDDDVVSSTADMNASLMTASDVKDLADSLPEWLSLSDFGLQTMVTENEMAVNDPKADQQVVLRKSFLFGVAVGFLILSRFFR